MKNKEIAWVPPWLSEEADIFGYPDSLIRARTARAYEFVIRVIGVKEKVCLDLGSGWGHGSLRCSLFSPRLVISTARLPGALLKQKEWFSPAQNILYTQLLADHLPYATNSIERVFFHHVIEHLMPQGGKATVGEIWRVLTSDGKMSLATPNPDNLIKPRPGEFYYSPKRLLTTLGEFFSRVDFYSIIPNEFAAKVHKRKQFLAKLPLTGKVRDLIPEQWEVLYGSGRRKVLPSDLFITPGVEPKAIDFLLIASKPKG